MKRVLSTILALLVGVAIGIAVDHFVLGDLDESFDLTVLQSQIYEISELATLEEDYTAQQDYKGDAKELFGVQIPFTSKEMLLVFSGTIKGGPNMENAKIDADETLGTITVTLPHSEILSHEIDEDSIQVVSVKNGLFNRVTPENTNKARKQGKEKKEKETLNSDFLDRADEKAVEQITAFLESAYPDAKISVEVK